ncbi:MAG TPA: hypothetical protein VK030_03575 [Actinomycetales bacterium]|nr:hypothetical protein [Actinomycetales bacterium]
MTDTQPSAVPDPKPMPVNLFRLMLFGTVLWAITALVLGALALLVPKVSLGLWPWISLAGVGLGLLGMLWARFNED